MGFPEFATVAAISEIARLLNLALNAWTTIIDSLEKVSFRTLNDSSFGVKILASFY